MEAATKFLKRYHKYFIFLIMRFKYQQLIASGLILFNVLLFSFGFD